MRRFWSSKDGNIAVLFAVAIVPLVGAIGAAADYSIANSYRTDMQKALDSTALALSKIMPANQSTLDTVGMQYFLANLGPNTLAELTLTVTPDVGQVRIRASGFYAPRIANVLGLSAFEISTESTAKWSIGKVEVALVLDNSGSMADLGRMTQLKAATHSLLEVLQTAAQQPDDAKVAIVPFDSEVRLPYNQTNAPNWVKFGASGSCSIWPSFLTTQSSCNTFGGIWTWNTWTSTAWGTWGGCVADRDVNVNHDVLDTAPVAGSTASARQTQYPAKLCDDNSLQTILPLTTNWGASNSTDPATLHGKVYQMQPAGWTNIAIGMAWGWHLLSPTLLYNGGAAYGTANLTKYIILMTDGNNTRHRYYNCPTNGPCATIDARVSAVCTNIKAQNIQIYTIRLVEGNASLLQACATNINMYYDVQNASQLSSVFSTIGAQIASLHLTK